MLPRRVEVYIIVDGPVRLEIEFPEFAGTKDVEADGSIDAAFKKLSPSCLTPTCTSVYGGASHFVRHGFAASLAYSTLSYEFLVSRGWANRTTTCAYPDPIWAPNTPPYRQGREGCDVVNEDDMNDTENQTYARVFPRVWEGRYNHAARGKTYTG